MRVTKKHGSTENPIIVVAPLKMLRGDASNTGSRLFTSIEFTIPAEDKKRIIILTKKNICDKMNDLSKFMRNITEAKEVKKLSERFPIRFDTKPQIINELRLGIAEFDTINPILSNNRNAQDIAKIIYEIKKKKNKKIK